MNNSGEMPDEILRQNIFPEPELPSSADILSEGRKLARSWTIGPSAFLVTNQCACESEYKRKAMASRRIMQHAHVGFRDKAKSLRALSEIYERTISRGVTVDRYGVCLDWSMGFPRGMRDRQMQGTGLILAGIEDFAAITSAAPVAPHFGDFMLGFPAALENTQGALCAGATTIGNLGQYFTFRLPNWTDEIETTRSTLTAIALMAAQPVDVLVHSNLDDGFAAVFTDLSCALGAAMIEKYLIEDLMGGKVTHCYGHHYSTPVLRAAFQKALSIVSPEPGSMIFGNTVSYVGEEAENYASLSAYLLVDIRAQMLNPSGHAVNPVPVTENSRIPDIGEIVDAQLFAHRLIEASTLFDGIVDSQQVDATVETLILGAKEFKNNLLQGFENAGFNTRDAVEMFLAIRRIGGKKLELLFGPGKLENESDRRIPGVMSDTCQGIDRAVEENYRDLKEYGADQLQGNGLCIIVATTDVHEHGKMLLEGVLKRLGIATIDGGVSVDPGDLARVAESTSADAIALSTYCGVALTYYGQLQDELTEKGLSIPVLIGGQLNEIPEKSESSLPVNVESELTRLGAIVCNSIHDAMPCFIELSQNKNLQPEFRK
jgi:methylmalonyl-CoA mutase cobalamin-binding subunit